jgi:hypothetical protein
MGKEFNGSTVYENSCAVDAGTRYGCTKGLNSGELVYLNEQDNEER